MTYQNRKDSSVSIRLIIKTPKATTINHIKYERITKDNVHPKITRILKEIEDDLCINLFFKEDNEKK